MNKDKNNKEKADEYYTSPFAPKIIQWVIKYSGGKINEKQAYYVVFGFIVFLVIISLFLIFNPPAEAPMEQVIPPAEF